MSTSAPPTGGPDIELEIGGMTCASCANRIEKKLNKLEGVAATVNYATEKAKVTYTGDVAPDDLVAAVEDWSSVAQDVPRQDWLLTVAGLVPSLVAQHDDEAAANNTVDLYVGTDANWWVGVALLAVAATFIAWAALRPVVAAPPSATE